MKIRENQYIHLMGDCLPVQGATNAALYDLSRGHIHSFANDFFDAFDAFEQHTYGVLKTMAEEAGNLEAFEDFITFLHQHNMIMALDDAERALFPKIDFSHWDKPCIIQNAIIDLADQTFDFQNIFSQLDSLGCEFLQVRQYGTKITLAAVRNMVQHAFNTSLLGMELLLAYDERMTEADYQALLLDHPIISSICVHGAPEDKGSIVDLEPERAVPFGKALSFVSTTITGSDHCGVIDQSSFASPKTDIVAEFKQFNGCLNRKISIDQNGYIKNCPSMAQHYGHISQTTLDQALAASGFKDVWAVHKDTIEVCKDCEYRYVCSDCRVYTQNGGGLAKPEKCQYNPHTGTWAV